MHLFHYHLVTSKVREVEARYLGKLGFDLVARHGRIAEEMTSFESGHGWQDLDRLGFKLRLTELERGAVNVVVQPGQWELPRVDHLGFALDDDEFVQTLARAEARTAAEVALKLDAVLRLAEDGEGVLDEADVDLLRSALKDIRRLDPTSAAA